MLDLDAPFLLTLSACLPNDPLEDEKIRILAKEIDRYFSLLQVQSAYDSNEFADSLYLISETIREQTEEHYRPAFDAQRVAHPAQELAPIPRGDVVKTVVYDVYSVSIDGRRELDRPG